MQIGTVTSRFVADAAGYLKTMAQMSAAHVKQSESLKTAARSTVAFGKSANETITGIRMFREEVTRVTDRLGGNAKQMLAHRSAVSQYKNEMQGATRATRDFNHEASRTSDISKQLTNLVGVGASLALITEGVQRLKAFASESAKAAAEVETLDRVLQVMGQNAGYSIGFLRDQVQELRDSGIEAAASARGITDFLKTGLPLNRIRELSKLAQDLAVIGGTNSTESFQRITWGITTGQTDVLRVAGLNVSFETAYAKAAASLGKSMNSLTEAEKLQARLQEVMKQAPQVAGAYRAAMETAGKQLSSMPRLIDDVKVALGDALLPVFQKSIFAVNNFLKAIRGLIEEGPLGDWLQRQAKGISTALEAAATSFTKFIEGANLGPLLVKVEHAIGTIREFGTVGVAAVAGLGSKFLSMIPIIGKVIAPFTGWQVAIATFIVTNEKLRKGVWEVVVAVFEAAQRIAAALTPAIAELTQALGGTSNTLGRTASFIARQIELYSTLAAMLIDMAVPALRMLIEAVKALGPVLMGTPILTFVRWLFQLVAGSEEARFRLIALTLALKTFISSIVSGVKTAGLMYALDGISRSVKRLQGDTEAFTGMRTLGSRMMTAVAAATALSLAMLAVSYAMQKQAQMRADFTKNFDQLFDNAKAEGNVSVLKTMNGELERVRQRARDAAGGTNDMVQSNNKLKQVLGSIWEINKNALADFSKSKNPLDVFNRPMEQNRALEEIKAWRAAVQTVMDETKQGLENYREGLESETAKVVEELSAAQAAIARAVGNFGVEEGTFERLTPGMTKALEDALAQINQQVDAWATDYTSIGNAMLDKEVKGWDDLMTFYARQLERTAAFFAGLDLLKSFGAPQSLIDELLKGGAEKFGQAMQDLLVQANEQGPEATQAMIATLSQQKTMADTIVSYNKQKYANLALQSDEYQAKLTEEAAVQQKQFDALTQTQLTGLNELAFTYEMLSTAIEGTTGTSVEQKAHAIEAINTMLSMVDAARQAVSQGTAIDAKAIQSQMQEILARLPATMADEGLAAMRTLNTIIASNSELVNVAGSMGTAAGAALGGNLTAQVLNTLKGLSAKMTKQGGFSAIVGRVLGGAASGLEDQMRAQANLAQQAQLAALKGADRGGALYPREPDTKAADDMAKAADDAAKRIADIWKANPPLKLFGDAMDQVWGKQMRYIKAQHAMADAGDDLASTIYKNARSTDSQAKKQQALENAVMASVTAIREQVEAMADLGLVGNSVEAMAAATAQKIDELKATLPGLVAGMEDVSRSAATMEETLSSVHDAIDKSLGRYLSAEEAVYSVEEQIDRLNTAYIDQIDLLTNTALEGKDVRDIKRATNKELIAAVRAIQGEAKALAESGQIGADAASQTAFMTEKLKELEQQFPELGPQIRGYIQQLEQIPENVKTEAVAYIDNAIAALDWYKVKLAQVPTVATTIVNVLLNDAALQAANTKAAEWNGLRQYDLRTEQGIAASMWDQAAAINAQETMRGSGGNWIQRMVGNIQNFAAVVNASLGVTQGVTWRHVYDSGGMLQPGMTMAANMSGKPEYVFTGEQVRALHMMGMSGEMGGIVGGSGKGNVSIGTMTVIPREPPRQWFDEALWRASRGFGAGAGVNGQTQEGWD